MAAFMVLFLFRGQTLQMSPLSGHHENLAVETFFLYVFCISHIYPVNACIWKGEAHSIYLPSITFKVDQPTIS